MFGFVPWSAGLPCGPTVGTALARHAGLMLLAALVAWGGAPISRSAELPATAQKSTLTNLAELPLEQLGDIPIESVSTASRFSQKVSEAPASVSVITSEDFKHYGYRTLADALRSVRGLYVTDDRTYSYLGIRGFNRPGDYNSRVLIMVDGHRVNDNVFEGAYIAHEFVVDADMIDRVEVVRGPSSSLYGSSAFFGVINVITKSAAAVKNAQASVEAGSYESYKARFSCAGVLTNAGASLLLSGSLYDSEGHDHLFFPEFNTPANNNGIADHLDHEEAYNLLGKLSWRELTLSAAYVSRDKHIPTASWGTVFNDPRYHAVDEHGYVDLKLDHKFNDDTELTLRSYFDDVRYTADYPIALPVPDDVGLNRDRALGQMVGFEAQLIHRWNSHTLSFGTELRDHIRQEVANYNVDPPHDEDVNERHHSYDVGVYAQDQWAILTNLIFNAGVRYDHYETSGDAFNPRLGLIYSPWEKSAFKLLYGTAFRAPNTYELFFPLSSVPRIGSLEPEHIQTYELVYEQYLASNLRMSLSGYYYHIDNLITLNTDSVFVNADQVGAKGVEGELEWRLASGIQARASYAVQRATFMDSGRSLVNSPQHLAKFNLLVPVFKDKLFTGVELQYASRVKAQPGDATAFTDGYAVANLTLFSQNIVRGLEVSASLYNLFDTRYALPGGPGLQASGQDRVYQDGRSFRVKLTYRF